MTADKGKTTDGEHDVHAVSGGVQTYFLASGIPVTLGAKINVLTNPGVADGYKVVELEGYASYPIVTSGPNNNARLIFDIAYVVGYDSQIDFKGTFGAGLTLALCSNNRTGETPDWRLCWYNNAKTGLMVEKAVYVEASSLLEIQKKINDDFRLRGGVRATASGFQNSEENKGYGAVSVTGVLGVDWDFIPAAPTKKKEESKSKSK